MLSLSLCVLQRKKCAIFNKYFLLIIKQHKKEQDDRHLFGYMYHARTSCKCSDHKRLLKCQYHVQKPLLNMNRNHGRTVTARQRMIGRDTSRPIMKILSIKQRRMCHFCAASRIRQKGISFGCEHQKCEWIVLEQISSLAIDKGKSGVLRLFWFLQEKNGMLWHVRGGYATECEENRESQFKAFNKEGFFVN